MSFADTLKNAAKESGQKTIVGKKKKLSTDVKKTDSKGSLAAALSQAKKEDTSRHKEVTQKMERYKRGEMDTNFERGPVKVWSFSSLKAFENCPWQIKLSKVDKLPQKSGQAAERGSFIHDQCEQWVRGGIEKLPHDNKTKFDQLQSDFDLLKAYYDEGKVQMEENWGIRTDWSPCDWDAGDELWGRGKLDAFILEDEKSCRIIDYKTGRRFGNEYKHMDQGLSYALHAMHRYPELDVFQVEFWYIDDGTKMVKVFKRAQLQILLPRYHDRAVEMTTTTSFIPNANKNSCRFCPYGSNRNKKGEPYGTGVCSYDAYKGDE